MDVNEDQKYEKIGRGIVTFTWFVFAAKFILIATIICAIICYFISKPLWLAPIIGIGVFIIYRLIWRLIWVFIGWASRQ